MASTARQVLPPAQVDCKWWKQGYCARGKKCYFRHDEAMAGIDKTKHEAVEARGNGRAVANAKIASPSEHTVDGAGSSPTETPTDASPSQICTICLETPDTFGLLLNCDHIFCLECIRNWRSSTSPSNDELKSTSKTCPMCRSHSDFIIPSSHFPLQSKADSTPGGENTVKNQIVDGYLSRLKTIPCRYFQQSVEDSKRNFRPKCRFGNSCHYAHTHPVTKEPYIFSDEEKRRTCRKPRQDRAWYFEEMMLMERMFNDLGFGYDIEDESDCEDEEDHDILWEHALGFP